MLFTINTGSEQVLHVRVPHPSPSPGLPLGKAVAQRGASVKAGRPMPAGGLGAGAVQKAFLTARRVAHGLGKEHALVGAEFQFRG